MVSLRTSKRKLQLSSATPPLPVPVSATLLNGDALSGADTVNTDRVGDSPVHHDVVGRAGDGARVPVSERGDDIQQKTGHPIIEWPVGT